MGPMVTGADAAGAEAQARSLDDTDRRILAATIELATEGGYDAVRQRDVASRARVALATLYARFDGKDALLAAALELESAAYVGELRGKPVRGRTPLSRVTRRFEQLTEILLRNPQLTRASLRAAASGEPGPMVRMMHAQAPIIQLIAEALRGRSQAPDLDWDPAYRVAALLVMVWFANLTAWAGGLADGPTVVEVVHQAADMLLHGVRPES